MYVLTISNICGTTIIPDDRSGSTSICNAYIYVHKNGVFFLE